MKTDKEKRKIIRIVMRPKMMRFLNQLKLIEEGVYFELTAEEKIEVVKRVRMVMVEETIKVLGGMERNNLKLIMMICIETLQSFLSVFEELENYSSCQLMTDAIKLIENDIQELVEPELQ
jgi:hypothetical protein